MNAIARQEPTEERNSSTGEGAGVETRHRNLIELLETIGVAEILLVPGQHLRGDLDLDASDKAARFVRTCNAFNVPLVTLVDAPGFWPGSHQEHAGLLRHGAKLLFAWAEATVPKISVVLRKMHGGAIPAMGVHEIGFDRVFAWPSAEMQILAAEPAVKILYRRELEAAADPEALFAEKVRQYRDAYTTPYHAAALSVVDAVIRPEDTRCVITTALATLGDRRSSSVRGNIPL